MSLQTFQTQSQSTERTTDIFIGSSTNEGFVIADTENPLIVLET